MKTTASTTYVSQSYPWGLFRRNGHRMLCADGKIRAVEMAETADTFFSVPARCRINGQWVSGYATTEEHPTTGERVYCFRQHTSKAPAGFPEWPTRYDDNWQSVFAAA